MNPLLPLSKISRVGITAENSEAVLEAYSRFFGIKRWEFRTVSGDDYEYSIASGSAGPVDIEVVQPISGQSFYSDYLDSHGQGLSHIVAKAEQPLADLLPGLASEKINALSTDASELGDRTVLDSRVALGGLTVVVIEGSADASTPDKVVEYNHEAILPVQQLYQVSVMINDLAAAQQQYEKILGISAWVPIGIDTSAGVEDATYYGEPVEHTATLAIGRRGEICMELVQPLEGPTVYRDALTKYGETMHHIMVTICPPDQFQQAIDTLQPEGIVISQGAAMPPLMGFGYFDGGEKMPGTFVEVITPLSDNWLEMMFPDKETARIVVGDLANSLS
ncbi:MAG: VOC family protein [Immundisolibacteraceae bacterium]|nr:VOC family protein [Immundisolibacteraceae bacterium]